MPSSVVVDEYIVWRSEGPCLLLLSSMRKEISSNVEFIDVERLLFEFLAEIVEKFSFGPQNVERSKFLF